MIGVWRTGDVTMPMSSTSSETRVSPYSAVARAFHWTVAALVLVQIPIGLYMVYRGTTLNIWDGLTNNLYSSHKLIGMIILVVMVGRLAYRLINGAPGDHPTLEPWQKVVAHATHWSLYGLLIGAAIGGWLGVSYYGALGIFDWFSLPALAAKNQDAATQIFAAHAIVGFIIMGLVMMHIGAAFYHMVILKDGLIRRMLPRKSDLA
jgi:cytochrome b561